MNKSVLILMLVSTAVLLAAGCRRIDPLGQTSDVDLVFSAEELGTKSDDSATLQDGGKFKNLFVILATGNDTDGYTAKYYDYREYESPTPSGIVRFRNVVNDPSYQVFAFANLSFEGDYWENSKTTWEARAGVLANSANLLSERTSDGKLILNGDDTAVIASSVASLFDGSGAMLLTGKGTVTVSGSTVTVTGFKPDNSTVSGMIKLHRPFVKLTVAVHSPVGHTIRFDQLSFSAFKPDKTYLLNKTKTISVNQSTKVVPVIPDGVTYSEINVAASSLPSPAWEGGSQNKLIYSTYLFENDVDDDYIMYGHVIMDEGVSGKEQALYLGLGEAPENPDPEDPPFKGNGAVLQQLAHNTSVATPIAYMLRNQEFNVIINVYYGSSTGDFNFGVSTWVSKEGEDNFGGAHTFK